MIDVLTKLREIAESKPELVKDAVDNVERTNPKAVTEGGMKDYLHDEAEKLSREEFIKKHGESLAGFWDSINGTEESAVQEDTSDDIMQWAKKYSQYKNLENDNLIEALYDFAFDLGITQMTFEVGELQAAERKLGKKQEDWEDAEINAAMEMSPISNGLMDELHRILPGNAELEQKLNSIRNMLQKAGLKEDAEDDRIEKAMKNMQPSNVTGYYDITDFWKEHTQMWGKTDDEVMHMIYEWTWDEIGYSGSQERDELAKRTSAIVVDALKNNKDDMTFDDMIEQLKGKKETVKEAIQISADSPQEASMMMQILKLAGVQQVDQDMISQEPEHGSDMDPGAMNKQMDTDDAAGSMDMARMRDIIKNPEDEQKEETFANEPEEKVQDIDSLVNKHSGGLNRQKQTHPRVSPGDNPMAAEDKITEEELANSLRTQYESFKTAYQEAAKPDFLDMDKDGDKKEPMKKAIKDKEAK